MVKNTFKISVFVAWCLVCHKLVARHSHIINDIIKTGSLDNAIREFSLAKPSWYMSFYTMIYKNGERMRDFLGFLFLL